MTRPTALTGRRGAVFLATLAVNLVLLYWPRGVGESAVPHLDKVVHAATFASVAWAGLRAGVPGRWLAALLAAHAVTSELVQQWLLPGRDGDPADAVADVAGIALGLIGESWRHGHTGGDERADRPAARGDAGAR